MILGGVTGKRFERLTIIKENIPKRRQAAIINAEWKIQFVNQLSDAWANR